MEGTPHITVPHQESDSATFRPMTKLPEHLEQYNKISSELRMKMTPVMQAVLELTDKMALRSAALPQSN